MTRRWFLSVFSCLMITSAHALESYPTNSVAFVALDEHRTNLWANNFKDVSLPLKSLCWVLQADFNFYRPCIQKLSANDVFIFEFDKELFRQAIKSKDPVQLNYIRKRLSVFDQPIPYAPPFGWPQQYLKTKTHLDVPNEKIEVTPIEPLIKATETSSFDSIKNLIFVLTYQFAMTRSFENVQYTQALQAAWNFWERAVEEGKIVCFDSLMNTNTKQCAKAIRVHASKPSIEPNNFTKGIAICEVDSPKGANDFFFHCSLMTMEDRNQERYVKSIVAPTMGMGGGTYLVDEFGSFQLACKLSQGTARDRLTVVKAAFDLTGKYQLSDAVDIVASSRFQRFEAANRYGRFRMEVRAADINGVNFQILFHGKWWKENRDENGMPLFEDEDVYKFKPIFEKAIGGSCEILPKADPLKIH
jgi:hypothetical protein